MLKKEQRQLDYSKNQCFGPGRLSILKIKPRYSNVLTTLTTKVKQ